MYGENIIFLKILKDNGETCTKPEIGKLNAIFKVYSKELKPLTEIKK